jgi:hypothetical protein
MGQIFVIAIGVAVLLIGTFLFGRLFQAHGHLGRHWATAIGFVVSLAIVIAIEATYLATGLW